MVMSVVVEQKTGDKFIPKEGSSKGLVVTRRGNGMVLKHLEILKVGGK